MSNSRKGFQISGYDVESEISALTKQKKKYEDDSLVDFINPSMNNDDVEVLESPKREKEMKKKVRRLVFQKKKKRKYFNVEHKNVPMTRRYIDFYHYVLDLGWFRVFVYFFITYVSFHTIFGFLYFVGGLREKSAITTVSESYMMMFIYCFFFSINIMSTQGTFGIIVPTSVYSRSIVGLESFASYFFETVWIAFLLGKFARPSKMKKNFIFSKKAILRRNEVNDKYFEFVVRYGNIRSPKSSMMSVCIDFILLIWEGERFKIHHLDFKVYHQTYVSWDINFAEPMLPIPHQIKHVINENSPMYPLVRRMSKFRDRHFEVVCVIEGIDAATSHNYQGYFSWSEMDTFLNHEFEPCCFFLKKKNRIVVDYKHFHKIKKAEFDP